MNDAVLPVESRRCERCGEDVITIDVPGFGRREVLSKRRSTLHLCNLSRPSAQGTHSRRPEAPARTSPGASHKGANASAPRMGHKSAPASMPRASATMSAPASGSAPASASASASMPASQAPRSKGSNSRPGPAPRSRSGDSRKSNPRRERPNQRERGARKPAAEAAAGASATVVAQEPARPRPRRDQRPARSVRERKPVERACRDCGAPISIVWDPVANRRRAQNADGTTHRCDPTLFVPRLADCPTCGAPVLLRRERGEKATTTTLELNGKVEHTCAPKAKTRILRATPEKAEDEKARPFAPIISDGEVRENECPACGNLMAGPPGARMCPHCSG